MDFYWASINSDGTRASIRGIYQKNGADKIIARSQTHLVLKSEGYSENPGSRYSRLRSRGSSRT